jgi:hypothetical protein
VEGLPIVAFVRAEEESARAEPHPAISALVERPMPGAGIGEAL